MDEKTDVKNVEQIALEPYALLSEEDANFMRDFEPVRGKKVIRKIDWHLVPLMCILYLASHVDRGNLGNASIEGLNEDIGLVGNQYNIASTLFFVPYIIFEIPSNIVLKKVRPSFWLPIQLLAWGLVMTLMGLVKNFHGLLICRIFLGLCEAGFFPGAVYLVSSWYPRHELQQRIALFYTASAFSGAMSGLLAYGIAAMNGLRGLAGWQWIFIVEGAVTIAIGLIMPFLISDSPEKASWLDEDEKRFIDLRLRMSGVRSSTSEGDKFSWKLLMYTMLDWKIFLGILIAWANSAPNAAFSLTLPKIIKNLGFTTTKAQLLTIPPYFCGALSSYLVGRLSDRFSWRMPFIVGPLMVLAVALGVLYALSADISNHVGALYFAIILADIGIYPLLPGFTAWVGNNLGTSWKRSIGLAWLLSAGNCGSLVGTNIFLAKESPEYPTGYGTSIGIVALAIFCALLMEFCLWRLNKAKKKMTEFEIRAQYTQEQLDAMGEKSPLWLYTL